MTENPTPTKIDCKVTKVNESLFASRGENNSVELSLIIPRTIISIFTNITVSKFCCCPGVMMAINNVIKPPMFTAEAKIVSKSQPEDDWGGGVSVSRARKHWPGRLKHLPCNEVLLGDQVC